MNYLAHAVLSFDQEKILVGNMLGDFVKGKNYLQLPADVQKGILLHRFIDRSTDEHPIVLEAMSVFRPSFFLSNGVFVDIFFDHFLANDRHFFDEETLRHFTKNTYQSLLSHQHLFDEKMSTFFNYMEQYNWLYHYKSMEGVSRSIRGICKRHPRLGDAEQALAIFERNYEILQTFYFEFFPLLIRSSKEKMEELMLSNSLNP